MHSNISGQHDKDKLYTTEEILKRYANNILYFVPFLVLTIYSFDFIKSLI